MAGENMGLDLASQTGQEDIVDAISDVAEAISNLSKTPQNLSSNDISYDNTLSGMTADDVQSALDELSDEKQDKLTFDNTPTQSSNNPVKSGGVYTEIINILGTFATYEATSTASKAYAVGKRFIYNGYLYKVTTAIAQGGTIIPNTNCVQTTVEKEIENRRLWFKNVAVSPLTNGSIIDLADSRLTADYVLEGGVITWGDESKITSLTNWSTETAGHFIVTGTASSATTATFSLVKADDRIENTI